MKKIMYACLAFAMLSSSFSCKKNLEIAPDDFMSPEQYFKTEAHLNAALNAIYELLGRGPTYRNDGQSLFNVFNCNDEMFAISSSTTDNPQNYSYGSSLAGVNNLWVAMYEGIERASILLEKIDQAENITPVSRENIRGQAKFLRAYYYFFLVSNFGDVPLKTKPTASVLDIKYARTPASEVYDFIIKEMTEAEAMVYPITKYTHNGRVTQSAVRGILARVCLHKAGFPHYDTKRYKDALDWAEKVISSGMHSLSPDYSQVFINTIQDKYDLQEMLWEAEFYTTGATDALPKSGGWGNALGIRQLNTALGYSVGSTQVHPKQYYRYGKGDLRRDWAIAPYKWQNDNATAGIKQYYTDAELDVRRPGKWRREYELQLQKITNYNSTNGPILRYADVLLMAAEAENEVNGPTQKAIDLVNQVRRRGYGGGKAIKAIAVTDGGQEYTSAPTVTITGGGAVNTGGLLPAAATAIVSDGKVSEIRLTQFGTFYNTPPVITISGGGGNGAIATATLAPLQDADLPVEAYASKDAFRFTIQEERARELCFEGFRRLDLIRWGILVPTMKALANEITLTGNAGYKPAAFAGNNITEKYNLMPLPLRELSLNPLLVQNPGF
jgi:hypothetical protein